MLKVNLIRRLVCALVVTIALGAANTALADPILPGFDLFNTRPGTFHIIPNIGIVLFTGGPPLIPETNTDTIVERLQGIDPLPVGGMGTIDIILRELSLQSVAPVLIGGTLFDITATAAPMQSLGSMTIFHTTVDGGTFTSILPVDVLLTFMPVGGGMSFSTTFSTILTSNCVWTHTPPPGYPTRPEFPSGGFFVVGPCVEVSLPLQNEVHIVEPAQVPEPATLLLLASGLMGIAGFGRNRISRKKQLNCK
jgi:hypothetical protein